LTGELSQEKSMSQKAESARLMLERQNKEVKAKLVELEVQMKTRSKATIQSLESKIANLEEQLEAEARYGWLCDPDGSIDDNGFNILLGRDKPLLRPTAVRTRR
jgi:hypothetical protein